VLVAVSAGGLDPGPPLTADDVRVVVERLRQ
jgi:hypothetical protein